MGRGEVKITMCKGRLEFLLEPEDGQKSYPELFWEAVDSIREWLLLP